MPVEMVTDVLKIAKNYYPHLKYISIERLQVWGTEYVNMKYILVVQLACKSRIKIMEERF